MVKSILFGIALMCISALSSANHKIWNAKEAEAFLESEGIPSKISDIKTKNNEESNVYLYHDWFVNCSYNRFEEEKVCATAKINNKDMINFYIGLVGDEITLVFGTEQQPYVYNVAMKIDNNPTIYNDRNTLTSKQIIEQMRQGKTLYYRYRVNGKYEEYELDLTHFNDVYLHISQLDISQLE